MKIIYVNEIKTVFLRLPIPIGQKLTLPLPQQCAYPKTIRVDLARFAFTCISNTLLALHNRPNAVLYYAPIA